MEGEVIAAGPGARNEQGHIVALDVKPAIASSSQMVRHRSEARCEEL